MPKKKPTQSPSLRHVWTINPKTRVKRSSKEYNRTRIKKIEKNWVDELFD